MPVQAFTSAGITSVVGLLGTDDCTRNTTSLVAEVRGLCEEGISAWCHTGGYHLPPVTATGSVRRDIVLVDRIIGVGEVAISDHRSSQPTLDEILRIAADTAHKNNTQQNRSNSNKSKSINRLCHEATKSTTTFSKSNCRPSARWMNDPKP